MGSNEVAKYGIDITLMQDSLSFDYGVGVLGPAAEIRKISDIRSSLSERDAPGPEELYGIAMDVYRKEDLNLLLERDLLFGVVTFSAGQIGQEPVRSQGHRHAISLSCNSSTPEVYEIWEGTAIIYMQPCGGAHAGKCQAVYAQAGDIVIVPPNWIHATINGDITKNMSFGAWCVRDYGFDYRAVRERGGIAFFPKLVNDAIKWEFNRNYDSGELDIKAAREYPELDILSKVPIYKQFTENPDKFLFVSKPYLAAEIWREMNNDN